MGLRINFANQDRPRGLHSVTVRFTVTVLEVAPGDAAVTVTGYDPECRLGAQPPHPAIDISSASANTANMISIVPRRRFGNNNRPGTNIAMAQPQFRVRLWLRLPSGPVVTVSVT